MKKNLPLLALAMLINGMAAAQVNIPIHKGQTSLLGRASGVPSLRLVQRIDSARTSMRYEVMGKQEKTLPDGTDRSSRAFFMLPKSQRKNIDSNITVTLDNFKDIAYENAAEQLNEDASWIQPLLSAGLNNIVRNGNSTAIGNLTIGAQIRITPFKQTTDHRIDPHFIYVAWNTSSVKSADSNNILKTLVFPELAKNDFIIGWHNEVYKGNITRGWAAEISLSTYKDSSGTKLFRSENFTFGYKWGFSDNLPHLNVPAGFQLFPYCNVINIDPKYNSSYGLITGNIPIHNTFFSLGLRVQAEISGATLYFNGKYIMNKHGDVSDPDLIRFVYTVGTLVAL